jgi:DNA-binding XRE family transcriptional regulator
MKGTVSELQEIRDVFGLSRAEMADLLGRRAQSIVEWETRGVPREKRASVERLLDLAQLFRRRVIASRIPEIVRTPDAWLGNRTILETLRIDGVDPIYGYLGRLFHYGGV